MMRDYGYEVLFGDESPTPSAWSELSVGGVFFCRFEVVPVVRSTLQ